MFVGLIVLLVLVALCVALGAIYSYIYFTRINPTRSRKYASHTAGDLSPSAAAAAAADEPATAATHLFLFRKSNN